VVANPKPVSSRYFIAYFDDLFAGKLYQFAALRTVQVVVFRISIIKLVHTSPVEFETVEQPSVDELAKGAIDRWSGDIIRCALGGELIDQLVGIEVLVPIEDLFEQVLFLVGVPQPARLKKLLVASQGSHRDRDRSQWFGFCHWLSFWNCRIRHGETWNGNSNLDDGLGPRWILDASNRLVRWKERDPIPRSPAYYILPAIISAERERFAANKSIELLDFMDEQSQPGAGVVGFCEAFLSWIIVETRVLGKTRSSKMESSLRSW